jgi:hypothetical protein
VVTTVAFITNMLLRGLNCSQQGSINEGFREANEITLNADVAALYSRPEKRYKRQDPDGQQSHWNRHTKY